MAAEALQDMATTSSWVKYMPLGGRQRERWWCRCCRVWFSRRPKASLAPGATDSAWFWVEKDNVVFHLGLVLGPLACWLQHHRYKNNCAGVSAAHPYSSQSWRVSTCLFLGFLVWVVVAVVGFDGIGLLHLLVTVGRSIQPLHNSRFAHMFSSDTPPLFF